MRFYYDNKFDDIPISDVTVSSAESAYPKDNLQRLFRQKVWRATGDASEYVKWDFGSGENSNYIAIVNHNLSLDATITITASDNADMSSPLLNATYDAWEPVFGFGEGGFGEMGFGGYIPSADLEELASGAIRVIHFDTVTARYWQVTFADSTNPDDYVEAGRILTGMYWEPERGFRWEWEFAPLDESKLGYSEGGQAWADIKPKRYEVKFTLAGLTDTEKYWKAIDMLRRWGKRKSILISLLPEGDPSEKFFTTIYGRFRRIPAMSPKFINIAKMDMIFTEDL